MAPALLKVEHLPSGFTRLTYDVAVDKRATVVVHTSNVDDHFDGFDPILLDQLMYPLGKPGTPQRMDDV